MGGVSRARKPDQRRSFRWRRQRRSSAGGLRRNLHALACSKFPISAAGWVVFLFILLAAVLTWQSWTAIVSNGLRFFTSANWDPSDNVRDFGSLAFVYGTIVTSVIAMLIAVPLGVGTATFLSEIASSGIRRIVSFLVEMLAAIPSVVYGFWA